MHMHCCFVYTVVLAVVFLYAEVVILFIPRGTSLRLISISILISIFTFFHKNHESVRHPRAMPPNASKTVFGEYPISHTRACSLTCSGSRKYPIASSLQLSVSKALTVAFDIFSLPFTRS